MAPAPSLDRLRWNARDALLRLHDLRDLSLERGDREAARGVGAVIAQLRDLDQRIARIRIR